MTFSEAISSGFRNYVGFSGRASRSEFGSGSYSPLSLALSRQSSILAYCRAKFSRSHRSGAWLRSCRRSRWGYAGCTTPTEAAGGGCSPSFL